jgi:hypothetical protein
MSPVTTTTLVWLFPIVFMFHDFEELILFEPWLKRNAPEIRSRLSGRLPAFITKQIDAVLVKTTAEFALPVYLIFLLTAVSSFLAVEYHYYGLFLLASTVFCLHGLMHLGQALLLRRYIPAVVTSALIILPYGAVLFPRLLSAGIVTWPELLLYALAGGVALIPFILGMHWLGSRIAKRKS